MSSNLNVVIEYFVVNQRSPENSTIATFYLVVIMPIIIPTHIIIIVAPTIFKATYTFIDFWAEIVYDKLGFGKTKSDSSVMSALWSMCMAM